MIKMLVKLCYLLSHEDRCISGHTFGEQMQALGVKYFHTNRYYQYKALLRRKHGDFMAD